MPPARDQHKAAPPKWWSFVLAGLCYGLFTALAFPPAGVWALAIFAPVPLVWAGCRATQRSKRCALLTALGVLPLWIYEQMWLIDVTAVGYPLLAIYMSLYSGAFVWMFSLTRAWWQPRGRYAPLLPAFLVAPIIWTALEVIRGEVLLTGYAWYLAGHPLIESPRLAAPGALFGAYFVSFLTVMVSGALADAAGWMGVSRGLGGIGAAAAFVVWIATGIFGRVPPPRADEPALRIGVVQTNVRQDNKLVWSDAAKVEDWKGFEKMTREAAGVTPRPDLIAWPETMFPGEGLNDAFRRDAERLLTERNIDPRMHAATGFIPLLLKLQADIGIPMVVGAEGVEGLTVVKDAEGKERFHAAERYNSTYVVEGGRVRDERYDKIELTPFGEMIPYVWRWPALQQRLVDSVAAGGMAFDLKSGTSLHAFTLDRADRQAQDSVPRPSVRFVTPICFEATRGELCRRLVYEHGRRRADLILNMSNDGWFGPTSGWRGVIAGGRQQHLLTARWRCVELGVPMVRAVNTGISASIDRYGKIRQFGPDGRDSAVNVSGVMVTALPIPDAANGTVFGRIGNLFGWGTVVVAVVLPLAGIGVLKRRTNRA